MKIILYLFAIYFLYKLFFNFILPLAARHMFNKATQSMNGSFQKRANSRKEGEVRIETKNEKYSSEDGEYVDYTEVK